MGHEQMLHKVQEDSEPKGEKKQLHLAIYGEGFTRL